MFWIIESVAWFAFGWCLGLGTRELRLFLEESGVEHKIARSIIFLVVSATTSLFVCLRLIVGLMF